MRQRGAKGAELLSLRNLRGDDMDDSKLRQDTLDELDWQAHIPLSKSASQPIRVLSAFPATLRRTPKKLPQSKR
jgi:hypothetical protein